MPVARPMNAGTRAARPRQPLRRHSRPKHRSPIAMGILSRVLIFFIVVGGLGQAATIVLKRAWVEKFKNRATIEGVTFVIDHAYPRPNLGAADGDMHVAGRADKEVGLPMVAEVMNA